MKKHTKIFTVLFMVLIAFPVIAQDISESPIERIERERNAVVFVNFSTEGAGLGLKMMYNAFNQDTQIGYSFSFNGVRGEDEFRFIDPFTGNIVTNRKFFTTVVPLTISVKRRLFRDKIAPNFRPFLEVDAGPVWGYSFKTTGGFFSGTKKGKGQVSLGTFAGFGVEFGRPDTQKFSLTLGFHYYRFPDTLGEKRDFKGLDIRIGFIKDL